MKKLETSKKMEHKVTRRKAISVGLSALAVTALVTPSQISSTPNRTNAPMKDYDFEKQQLFSAEEHKEMILAGRFTSGSVQTFDSKGRPKDAQNDNND